MTCIRRQIIAATTSIDMTSARAVIEIGPLVQLVLDEEEFDFHIHLHPNYSDRDFAEAMSVALEAGYEDIPMEESEAEVLADGSILVYLIPMEDAA